MPPGARRAPRGPPELLPAGIPGAAEDLGGGLPGGRPGGASELGAVALGYAFARGGVGPGPADMLGLGMGGLGEAVQGLSLQSAQEAAARAYDAALIEHRGPRAAASSVSKVPR